MPVDPEGAEVEAPDTVSFADFASNNENTKGVALALMSSLFIGASFIIKKKGLLAAGQSGVRASAGGHSYLYEPLWWTGMLTMIGGEVANLAAYAYAPAIVVTPLGASTIVLSALLANCFLGETMHICGVLACALCVAGISLQPSRAHPSHCPRTSNGAYLSKRLLLPTRPCFPGRAHPTTGSVVLVRFAPAEAPLLTVEEIWVSCSARCSLISHSRAHALCLAPHRTVHLSPHNAPCTSPHASPHTSPCASPYTSRTVHLTTGSPHRRTLPHSRSFCYTWPVCCCLLLCSCTATRLATAAHTCSSTSRSAL